MYNIPTPTDGKKRVELYNIAIANGFSKGEANQAADEGVNLHNIRILQNPKPISNDYFNLNRFRIL